jgi:hypothetical protein
MSTPYLYAALGPFWLGDLFCCAIFILMIYLVPCTQGRGGLLAKRHQILVSDSLAEPEGFVASWAPVTSGWTFIASAHVR